MKGIIGVIGAGVMGKGVAQRFAQHEYQVLLYDCDEMILEQAKKEIEKNLRCMNMFNKKIDVHHILDNIILVKDYKEFEKVDYIVENVPEKLEVKRSVYMELDKVCKTSCILMANTSCIPITAIGAFTKRAGQVIGVHFMNPVPMKNFSEMIRGWKTDEATIESTKVLLLDVGIESEVINDSPGFVSNRLSHLFMNEAAFLVYEGVATAQQIDNIFKNAFGHKMGPLETADLIGVDTVLDSLKVLYDEYQDTKFRACPLLNRMVEAGEIGRKVGKGFYKY